MSDKQNRITPEGDILAPCELYEKATHIEIDGRLEKLSGSTGTMFWIGEGAGQLCLSNRHRADHKRENRAKDGGKKW